MLSSSSQLLLRNFDRLQQLASDRLLLVNPLTDDLALKILEKRTAPLEVLSNDYSVYQALESLNKTDMLSVQFGYEKAAVSLEPTTNQNMHNHLGILFMPREKTFLKYALAETIGRISSTGKVWLVGENRSGIKSANRQLEQFLGNSIKLDSARHCTLFEADLAQVDHFQVDKAHGQSQTFSLTFAQQQYQFITLPGVFSAGRLDPATAMLLDTLETMPVSGNILDFACGAGIIGLCLSQSTKVKHIDLIDVNAMAVESARLNLIQNQSCPEKVSIQASDTYSAVSKHYNVILSNPPFHRDSRQTLEVSEALIRRAPDFLNARGELRIVANRHLPYLKLFKTRFKEINILKSDRHFHVIQGKTPQ